MLVAPPSHESNVLPFTRVAHHHAAGSDACNASKACLCAALVQEMIQGILYSEGSVYVLGEISGCFCVCVCVCVCVCLCGVVSVCAYVLGQVCAGLEDPCTPLNLFDSFWPFCADL